MPVHIFFLKIRPQVIERGRQLPAVEIFYGDDAVAQGAGRDERPNPAGITSGIVHPHDAAFALADDVKTVDPQHDPPIRPWPTRFSREIRVHIVRAKSGPPSDRPNPRRSYKSTRKPAATSSGRISSHIMAQENPLCSSTMVSPCPWIS
jgi:hypothetical protein